VRYLWFVTHNYPGSHIQSLFAGGIIIICSFLCLVMGALADLTRINRILIDDQLELTKRALVKAKRR